MMVARGFLPWLLLHLVACRGIVTSIDVGRGAVQVRIPGNYSHTKSYPLVLLLPGYGTGAAAFYDQVLVYAHRVHIYPRPQMLYISLG